MGVTNLWQIIGPVQEHCTLSSLSGQTLAVDLSIWVCETQCVKQMQGVVTKPFLRNLFFRISHLLQLGIHLVFVVEGDAPDLKWETMQKRQQTRFPGKTGSQFQGYRGGSSKHGRRNFNAYLRECCELFDYLGIPYIESKGEAEAMCALLNAAGLVDGCLTNDGDAFLYGARTVYRNFTMNTKNPHVESYKMADVESELGLNRESLVAMALLLGCDYLPKGVPGVGMDKAVKLMSSFKSISVLERFKKWKNMSELECLDQIEAVVRRKAIQMKDFPQFQVIEEFMISKNKCPTHIQKWKRPHLSRLQVFCFDKLEWPVEYTLEKVLPLVTLWDMTDIIRYKGSSQSSLHLKPVRIVKARVRQGIQCYEIQWQKPVTDSNTEMDVYTTIETQELFIQCYPQLCTEYEASLAVKKTKTKGKKKKEDTELDSQKYSEVDLLTDSLANVSLKGVEKPEIFATNSGQTTTSETPENNFVSGNFSTRKDAETKSTLKASCHDRQQCTGRDNEPVFSVKPIAKCKQGKVSNTCFDQKTESVSVISDEEIDKENEEEYIPLSQRIQMNLKKSSKSLEKIDIMKDKILPSVMHVSNPTECLKTKKHIVNKESPTLEREVNTVSSLKSRPTLPIDNSGMGVFTSLTKETEDVKKIKSFSPQTTSSECHGGKKNEKIQCDILFDKQSETYLKEDSAVKLVSSQVSPNYKSRPQPESLNVTNFSHVVNLNFTVLTPVTTRTLDGVSTPIDAQSLFYSNMLKSLDNIHCQGRDKHSTPHMRDLELLGNFIMQADDSYVSESTPSSCRQHNMKPCLTNCLESPLLMNSMDSPLPSHKAIYTPSNNHSSLLKISTDNLCDHSDNRTDNTNFSFNMTDKDDLAHFGHFQVESSLLRSLELQHNDSPDQSDLSLPLSGNFHVESSLLKSVLYHHGKDFHKNPSRTELNPVLEDAYDFEQETKKHSSNLFSTDTSKSDCDNMTNGLEIENVTEVNGSPKFELAKTNSQKISVKKDDSQDSVRSYSPPLPDPKVSGSKSFDLNVDDSPVALADRLRAKLKMNSCRLVLGDITGKGNNLNNDVLSPGK